MGTSARGLEVGTDDADALAALDDYTARLARIGPGAEHVLDVAAAAPDVGSLRLAAAMLLLYGQTADTDAQAALHLDAAHRLDAGLCPRERALRTALDRWAEGSFLAAVEVLEALLVDWPRDLLALKAVEFLYYVLGQQHNGARFLATVEGVAPANPDDPDVLAVHAFAAELSGDPARATDLAEAAIDLELVTPWAHHALAHALITTGNPPSAVARLESFLPLWPSCGRVIWCHDAWHLAVAQLDRLDREAADTTYREHIWGVAPDSPGEQIDAISYLWRVEMAGGEVDDAVWHDIADHVETRSDECVFPFLTAHHGFALARAGRSGALERLGAAVAARVGRDDDEARRVWVPVGVPVVEACIAHGAGDLASAAALLDPVIGELTAVGGSDAQDDLFRLAYLTALGGAGRTADARAWWESMTAFKTPSPLDEHLRAGLA